jgi:parvulin-like peptidyl-prolyl isomerase
MLRMPAAVRHCLLWRCHGCAWIPALAALLLCGPGCESGPSLSAPVMPTTTRMQRADETAPAKSVLDLASYTAKGPPDANVAARICATVNGVPILDDELRETAFPNMLAIMRLSEPELSQRRREILTRQLDELIDREVILQEMFTILKERNPQVGEKLKQEAGKEFDRRVREIKGRAHLKSDEEFKAFLIASGLTYEGLKRQVERQFMAMEWMRNKLFDRVQRINREDLLAYYQGHPEEFRVVDSIVWLDIFVDASKFPSRAAAQEFAEGLAARARKGEDFAQLVKQYDQGDSSYRNGEGYGRRRGEIKPPGAEAPLFQMKAGDIGPVIEMGTGFHIIKLTAREYEGLRPFDEKTQKAIKDKLQGLTFEREYKTEIAELRRKATIEVAASMLK